MTFSATQIIGKTLYALTEVKIYHLPIETSAVINTIPRAGIVGVVFSYVEKDGSIWWMLQNSGYVKHEKNKFSISSLLEQGAIDEATLNAPTTMERLNQFLQTFLKTANWLLPLLGVILTIYFLAKTYKTAKP